MTIGEALRAATMRLENARIPSARLTSELLLAHCLGRDRPGLYTRSDEGIGAADTPYRDLVDRRIGGEPLQYITGVQEFYGRPFHVNPSVLIPRPETEFAVEAAAGLNRWPKPRIVDIGTGSGCIGITLALEIPSSEVTLTDVSFDALGVARTNATRLGAQVTVVQADSLAGLAGRFHLIVSNPPYVREAEYPGLQREVREHEPRVALVPRGETPGELYRRLVDESAERLAPGGCLVLEIGFSMEEAVRALFANGWELLPTRADLQGIPRVVVARRRATA